LQLSTFAPYVPLREKKESHSSSFLIFESIHPGAKKNCPGESREQSQNSKVKSQNERRAGLQLSAFASYAPLHEKNIA
jgi:hypothetical protein